MDRVDTTKLSNLAFYYMDLAMIHWKMQWMDSTHLDKYLQYNRRAAQLESTIATPYYNLATAFIIKKDCSSALAAAEAYYDHPKKIKGLEAELKKALKDCPSHPRKD